MKDQVRKTYRRNSFHMKRAAVIEEEEDAKDVEQENVIAKQVVASQEVKRMASKTTREQQVIDL